MTKVLRNVVLEFTFMRGKRRQTTLKCQTFAALTRKLFVQELLFEKINQTLHSVFHPISGQLLSDGMVTFLFQCRKITNFISLSALIFVKEQA